MDKGIITMSHKELKRLEILEQVKLGKLSQKEASTHLGISVRQVKRLWSKYNSHGPAGIVSKRRGRASNHQLPYGVKAHAISLIKAHYWDFKPTLAHEYLTEKHGLELSVETLRQEMIKEELWTVKRRRKGRVHQQRERRSRFGELVQLDGSPHDWFEGRSDKCCLLVLIDDATSALLAARFEKTETTAGYFRLVSDYFHHCGKPLAFYSDRHSIFRVNIPEANSGTGETQFGRACRAMAFG